MKDLIIRKTAFLLAMQIMAALLVIDVAGTLAAFAYISYTNEQVLGSNAWATFSLFMLAKIFIQGYLIMLLVYNWTSNTYSIRGHHLVLRHRLMAHHEQLYELGNMQSINVHQSWLGRALNYGSLRLEFAMPGEIKRIYLAEVHNPYHYYDLLTSYVSTPNNQQRQNMVLYPSHLGRTSIEGSNHQPSREKRSRSLSESGKKPFGCLKSARHW